MYRRYLWGKALKNHVKFASREELQRIIFEIMEIYVSFSDADKCDVDLIVPASISKTKKTTLHILPTTTKLTKRQIFRILQL